jgi:hypothetical protein
MPSNTRASGKVARAGRAGNGHQAHMEKWQTEALPSCTGTGKVVGCVNISFQPAFTDFDRQVSNL